MKKDTNNGANLGFEFEFWRAADVLRSNKDAAEYKHVVLGLIVLKYISDAFEEQHTELKADRAQDADPEDPDEYRAVNIFGGTQRGALEANDSAEAVLGDETLRLLAQELVKAMRNNITIDWAVRENVRAQMRVIIRRILRRYGYPPDKQAHATEFVLEQAEILCRDRTAKA